MAGRFIGGLCAFIAACAFAAQPAQAQAGMTAGEYLEKMTTGDDVQEVFMMTTYAIGLMKGIEVVNDYAATQERPYFCPPGNLQVGQPLLLEILRETTALDASVADYPVPAVAFIGLLRRYPC